MIGELPDLQDVLEALYAETFPASPPPPANSRQDSHVAISLLSDDEVHAKALRAANGAKYQALYNGGLAGYPSMSEGDSALACMYLFWTGGDVIQTERLLRASPRAEIDPKKRQQRADYWPRTIQNASNVVREYYQGWQGGPVIDLHDESESLPTSEKAATGDSDIERLRRENRRLRLEKRVLCNPHIHQEAPTLVALLSLIDGGLTTGKADDRGYVHVNYDRLAVSVLGHKFLSRLSKEQRDKVIKQQKDKSTRHIKRGVGLGLLDKTNQEVWLSQHRKISRALFRLHGDLGEHLTLLADFTPGEGEGRNWGGIRPCKECGSTKVVRKEYCGDCGALRKETEIAEDGTKTVLFDQDKQSAKLRFSYPQVADSVGHVHA